jgi:hypothetical protein
MNHLLTAAEEICSESSAIADRKVIERLNLLERAAEVAAKAAPYLHPKLASIEHTDHDSVPVQKHIIVESVHTRADTLRAVEGLPYPNEPAAPGVAVQLEGKTGINDMRHVCDNSLIKTPP